MNNIIKKCEYSTMSEIDALLKLLDDDDPQVTALVMENLLQRKNQLKSKLAELQESNNPKLRERIHQIESIITRKQRLQTFLNNLNKGKVSLWQDLIYINKLVDSALSKNDVQKQFKNLTDKVDTAELTCLDLCEFMREQGFMVPEEDVLDPDLYLIDAVLTCGLGSPLMSAIIAQKIAKEFHLELSIVLCKGKHFLLDPEDNLISPQNGWTFKKLKKGSKIYPCTQKDCIESMIAFLYLSAVTEGQLKLIYTFSKIIAILSNTTLEKLPYPIGKNTKEYTNE